MHLVLTEPSSEPFLLAELGRGYSFHLHQVLAPGLLATDFTLQPASPPILVFARQCLPDGVEHSSPSINTWSETLGTFAVPRLPEHQPWHLHVLPYYGGGHAGENRCRLIAASFRELLQRKRRSLLRTLEVAPAPFTPAHSLVQLVLTAPDRGFLSVATAPAPHQFRAVISPFPGGDIPVAGDKGAPSRAFAKLLEAEQRLGRRIAAGQVCVDLGAAPGSWSYVALQRGARVVAIDRAPLREEEMRHPRLTFRKGNAFSFKPPAPVDWLLCDVIAAPDRSIGLLIDWVRRRWTRYFVVSIKFKGESEYGTLEQLKHALPPLCAEFYLTRLSANKNEACAFGVVKE